MTGDEIWEYLRDNPIPVILFESFYILGTDIAGGSGNLSGGEGTDSGGEAGEDEKAVECGQTHPNYHQIASIQLGQPKGNNPKFKSGRAITTLPGGWAEAEAVFLGLHRLSNDTSILPGMAAGRPTFKEVSLPSGIGLRRGRAQDGFLPTIDIPANTFQLDIHETIHFIGGKGTMCPI